MTPDTDRAEEAILREVQRFVLEDPANRHTRLGGGPYFESPLVGYADAHDPLFDEIKKGIGDFYLTPVEVLTRSFPEHDPSWQGASVVSWVLPIDKATRTSNRKEKRFPSKPWAHTRTYGEEFNNRLRSHVVAYIQGLGHHAVAPSLMPFFGVYQSETVGFTSNWSERHAAFAAGLGTFSLSRGLITPKGIAMRCGSVVTSLQLSPSPRTYSDYRQHCLFFSAGTCGVCMQRCPAGAITEQGHSKDACMMHLNEIMQMADGYEAAIPGCGLCQTGVPCEDRIPHKEE